MTDIRQTRAFMRAYKKLHPNQKDAVDAAVARIAGDPTAGEAKKGDLQGVRVLKFDCVGQQFLLAYETSGEQLVLLLIGPHENFYRRLKQ